MARMTREEAEQQRGIIPDVVVDAMPKLSLRALRLVSLLVQHTRDGRPGDVSNCSCMNAIGTRRWQTFDRARQELRREIGLTWEAGRGCETTMYTIPR